jgi:hypothetical protein
MCISLGYPDRAAERALLAGEDRREAVARLQPVMEPDDLVEAMAAVRTVHASSALLDYLQALIEATRSGRWFVQGLSPRAGIGILRLARARALLQGRDHVAPDDLQALLPQALGHRLVPVAGRPRPARAGPRHAGRRPCPEPAWQAPACGPCPCSGAGASGGRRACSPVPTAPCASATSTSCPPGPAWCSV